MIKEAIGSILEAEQKAETIIKNANIKAGEIVVNAKIRSDNIMSETKEMLKDKAKQEYILADTLGGQNADKLFAKGEETMKILKCQSEENMEKAIDFIKLRLLEI